MSTPTGLESKHTSLPAKPAVAVAAPAASGVGRLRYGDKDVLCYRSRKLAIAQIIANPIDLLSRYPVSSTSGNRVKIAGVVIDSVVTKDRELITVDDGTATITVDCRRALSDDKPNVLRKGKYLMIIGHVRIAKATATNTNTNAAATKAASTAVVSVVAHQLNDVTDQPNVESFWWLEVADFARFEAEPSYSPPLAVAAVAATAAERTPK